MGCFGNQLGRLADLMKGQIRPASDVHQNGLRTAEELKVEQRTVQGRLSGLHRFPLAPTPANGHESPSGPL